MRNDIFAAPPFAVLLRTGAVALILAGAVAATALLANESRAQSATQSSAEAIKGRHIGVARTRATGAPRSESDQTLVDGWPMYRSERGQTAFNDTMATIAATEGAAPKADAFKGCPSLECNLALPEIGSDGWIPAGLRTCVGCARR